MLGKYIITQAYQGSLNQLCKQVSMPANFRVLLHEYNGPLTLKREQIIAKYSIEQHKEMHSKWQLRFICLILHEHLLHRIFL